MADVQGTAAELFRALRSIDPELRKTFVKRVKDIGKPAQSAIKSAIPGSAPLSGLVNNGRLGWGSGKPANSTSLKFKATGSKTTGVTSLLSVRANSAATGLADISGRKGSGRTPQGRALIRNLNARAGRASRFIWPAGLGASAGMEREIQITIDEASKVINDRYR